ncbi:MAG: redoxin domain-containing protein [Bacteroidota bacterium]|nr:redoxin domain-containing protein [Bacteroidota bacterium]
MIPHNPLHIHKLVLYCLVASCLSLGTIFIQTTASAQTNNKEIAPKVGDSAPNFSLQDFKGNKFTLSKLTKTKGVLLWFTNLCAGCQSQIPTVLSLKAEYEKKGVEVAAVSILGKDRKTVETVLKENKVSFRFLYDPNGTASKRYSGEYVEGTCPLKNIFVIEKGGKIVFANHLSGVQMNELKKLLDKLISDVMQKIDFIPIVVIE